MCNDRNLFSSRIGFILAAAGSAVGLGNIWRFPYLAAKNGGGMFLLIYILFALTVGISVMIAEISVGRKTGLSVCSAYRKLNSKFAFIGIAGAIVPVIILPYYSVIGGWILKYMVVYFTGGNQVAAADNFFTSFISNTTSPLIWFLVFILSTAGIIVFGVKKGIERASKFLMPGLFLLTVAIAIYTISLPGAMEGVIYYIKPNPELLTFNSVLNAMGQMFYSLSLAMGIMITYGSYLDKKTNIESAVTKIAIIDSLVAFLAGLMIIPLVFVFLGEEALGTGPGLMFVTLPKAFASMAFGNIIGGAFFILVLFAALTSAISLMEAIVASFQDEFRLSRSKAIALTLIISILLGIPSSLGNGAWSDCLIFGMDFLTFFDHISNNIIMPLVAILTCIFVGFVIKPEAIIEEVELSCKFRKKKLFSFMIRYIAPLCITIILFSQFL